MKPVPRLRVVIDRSLTIVFSLLCFSNLMNLIYELQTTPQFVDIVPSFSTASSVEDSLDNDDDDDYSQDGSGDEPRRKTRRSRRGGYRRKRQQQKKVAALMAESAVRRAQKATSACCDNSTTTSITESESSSCDSSATSTPPRVVAHKRIDLVNNDINNTSSSFHPVRDPAYSGGYPIAAQSPPARAISCSNYTYARNKHNNNNEMPYLHPEIFLAMDCEMVGVGKDGTQSALARVSILDYNGNVVMDEYIKPGRKVTDYRSFVSGITPEILQAKANMDYATCRKKVIKLLRGKVLVGHALENDLGILRINHPWYMIRDTAQYQPFMKVRAGAYWPRRLQDLALERLNRDVQVYGRPHCSAQDSLAALDLYKLASREWEASIVEQSSWMLHQQHHQQQQFLLQQQQRYAPLYAM